MCTYPCLAFRHNRKRKADHIDAFLQHLCRKILSKFGVSKHNRNDRMSCARECKTKRCHFLSEKIRILKKPFTEFRTVVYQFKNCLGCCSDNRRQCVRKQIGAGTLTQPFYDFFFRAGVASGYAPPSAFPRVPVKISTLSETPQNSGVPRPFSPMNPTA